MVVEWMMTLTKDTILHTLEEHRTVLRQYGVRGIELFGSYARGEQRPDSDIDFLVEFEPGRGLFRDYSDVLILLEDLFEKSIDLVKPHLVRERFKPYILDGERYAARL